MLNRVKKYGLRYVSFMPLIAIILLMSGCGEKPSFITPFRKSTGFEQVETIAKLENDKLKLEVDSSDGNIAVTDIQTNNVYYATNPNGIDNNWVSGPSRMKYLSQLSLNVIDKYGAMISVDSSKSAVRENGFLLRKKDNVIQSVYRFMDYKIEIAVEYQLDKDKLIVSIPTNKIRCDGDYTLGDINVLPYFGAGEPNESGQLLIPSGCGSLINFGSGKGESGFSEEVYGTDPMKLADYKTETGSLIALPMFAYMYQDRNSTVMAYIEKGASLAALNANASSEKIGVTTASFSFNYNPYSLVSPFNTQTQSVKYYMPTSNRSDIDEFSVSYQFFSENKSYFDLSNVVKERLSKNMSVDKNSIERHPLYLEMIMGVNKTVYTLGIPHKTNYPLSTISSVQNMIKDFKNETINMVLNGIDDDGFYGGKVDTDFSINSNIGTLSEYRELESTLKQNGGKLYSVTESTRFTKSSLRFPSVSSSAKSVNGKNVQIYTYRNGDGQKRQDITPLNLLQYSKINSSVLSVIKSSVKNDISGLAPFSISNTPYTSNSNYGDRYKTHLEFEKAAGNFTDNGIDLMLKAPDAEMLTFTKAAYSVPISSSNSRIFDEDIPFLQLVLNGLVSYSVPSVNVDGNSRVSMLKAIESSSSLAYTLYSASCEETENTIASLLIGSQYSAQKALIKDHLREFSTVMNDLGTTITSHKVIKKGVHLTEYGKNSVLINYTDEAIEYRGKTVEAMSYVLFKEGDKRE